jgi:chromosome segregation ATPase
MGLWSDKPKQKQTAARDAVAHDEMHIEEPPVQAAPAQVQRTGYGIADAINLMRSLPQDLQTTDIVVQVIKRTLESAKIDVAAIIVDATHKEDQIEKRIRELQEQIEKYQLEIQTRSGEITRLQADLEETSRVKERLVMAEKLTNAGE